MPIYNSCQMALSCIFSYIKHSFTQVSTRVEKCSIHKIISYICYLLAIISISIRAPIGKEATPIVVRAGYGAENREA